MKNEKVPYQGGFAIVKGVSIALGSALVLALLFALVVYFGGVGKSVIYPVNQGIKVVAVALGVLFSVRGEKGWLKGGIIGTAFIMLSYLAFSALGGDFSLSWLILAELLFGFLVGALCGIIAVNVRHE